MHAVDEKGDVSNVEILSIRPSSEYDELFKREVLETLASWRFAPALEAGRAVARDREWTVQSPPLEQRQVQDPLDEIRLGSLLWEVEQTRDWLLRIYTLPAEQQRRHLERLANIATRPEFAGVTVSPAAQGFHPTDTRAMRVYEFCTDHSLPVFVESGTEFAPGSVLEGGGGMKGYKDAPDDWEDQVKYFFGVDKLCNQYGFSECIGTAPMCDHRYFHFLPYAVPILMDEDGNALPREGVQKGRLVLVDPIPTSYWGGFTSGDEVTIHWDEDCPCGWGGPRAAETVRRFAESEGGDDKITCAGSQQAYNEFMEFVAGEG